MRDELRSSVRRLGLRVPPAGRKTAAGILVQALVVASLWIVDWRQDERAASHERALTTAVSSMQRLLSFNPSTVREEASAERRLLTGALAAEYQRSVVPQFGDIVDGEVTTVAEVRRAGMVSSRGGSVVVLMFANTTRTSPRSDTRISASRMQVTMKKVDGAWKISSYKSI